MDLNNLRKLVKLMEGGDLSELELVDEKAGTRVHLKRGQPAPNLSGMSLAYPQAYAPVPPGAGQAAPVAGPAAAGVAPAGQPGTTAFTSPMVGTFYRASSPDAEPFVEIGTRIGEDNTLCVIEAMKVMNEIKAETKGVIVEVLVDNGDPVEFGQPLFLLGPA